MLLLFTFLLVAAVASGCAAVKSQKGETNAAIAYAAVSVGSSMGVLVFNVAA